MTSPVKLPSSRQRLTLGPPLPENPRKDMLQPLLEWTQAQNLPEWDVLLVGDGSGSKWEVGSGWCCTLVERVTGMRQQFWGGMNLGTVPIAEIMPYVHALLWYADRKTKLIKTHKATRVLIVCDNQPLMQQGQQLARGARTPNSLDSNRPLWRALIGFQSEGFKLHFHWIERVTIALNRYADAMASTARKSIRDAPLPRHTRLKSAIDIYDVNIDEHEPLLPYKPPRKLRERASTNHAAARERDRAPRVRERVDD